MHTEQSNTPAGVRELLMRLVGTYTQVHTRDREGYTRNWDTRLGCLGHDMRHVVAGQGQYATAAMPWPLTSC